MRNGIPYVQGGGGGGLGHVHVQGGGGGGLGHVHLPRRTHHTHQGDHPSTSPDHFNVSSCCTFVVASSDHLIWQSSKHFIVSSYTTYVKNISISGLFHHPQKTQCKHYFTYLTVTPTFGGRQKWTQGTIPVKARNCLKVSMLKCIFFLLQSGKHVLVTLLYV